MKKLTMLTAIAASIAGCSEPVTTVSTPAKAPISYRTRAKNAPIKVLREHRFNDTEAVRLLSIPGFPYGERCVLYTAPQTSALQCGEDSRTLHD